LWHRADFIFRSPERPELAEGNEWRLRKINPAPILPYLAYLNINVLMNGAGTREARAANSRTPLWAQRFAVEPYAKLVLGVNIVDTAPLAVWLFI
jgi:hypothetical protein